MSQNSTIITSQSGIFWLTYMPVGLLAIADYAAKNRADARGLFCFWAVTELGCGQKELAKKLGMTQPGVGYAVIRGETMSKSNHLEPKG